MIKFSVGLSAVVTGAVIVVVQPQIATGLTAPQISAIASEITVRIDGANTGSGTIIERQANTYTVVTNWHVVQKPGNYTLQTSDGQKYTFTSSQVQRFSGVDLAAVKFTSNRNYRVAEQGNSDQITAGQTVYVFGWADPGPQITERSPQFLTGQVTSSRLPKIKDGYAFSYSVNALVGMSGGPVLDEEGKVIAINGRAEVNEITKTANLVLGIPLRTYINLEARKTNIQQQISEHTNLFRQAINNSNQSSTPANRTGQSLPSAEAYISRALERLGNKDEQGAIADFNQAQKLDSSAVEKAGLTLAQEAAQLAQFQQFDLALPRARLATRLASKNDKIWLLLGGLYLQKKEINTAIIALDNARELNPENPDIYFALGSAYFQQKNYSISALTYQLGLLLKPNHAEALFELGNVYYQQGKPSEAIAQYNKSLSQNPKFWPAVNNIGLIKYEQGDITGAIKQWQTAVSIDKQAAEPLLALAVATYIKGDRQQSRTTGEAALSIDKRYDDIAFLKENLWGDRLLADTKKFLQYLNSK